MSVLGLDKSTVKDLVDTHDELHGRKGEKNGQGRSPLQSQKNKKIGS